MFWVIVASVKFAKLVCGFWWLFYRFGDLKLRNPENRAFAQMFQKSYAGKILACHLNLLGVIRVGGYLPDRVTNLILQYLSSRFAMSFFINLIMYWCFSQCKMLGYAFVRAAHSFRINAGMSFFLRLKGALHIIERIGLFLIFLSGVPYYFLSTAQRDRARLLDVYMITHEVLNMLTWKLWKFCVAVLIRIISSV